jgi:predicted acylesterase/phospholipase RssA
MRLSAEVPGMPGVRYFADEEAQEFLRDGIEALQREQALLAASGHQGALPPVNFLAISGGGDDGAFGAGLLVGWTAAGDRPQFKGVTGISTGALIAPFAFLGPEYDHVLKHVYTNTSAADIFKPRNLLFGVFKDAMADTTPLYNLVKHYVNQKTLDDIAAEHAKGRLLLIGTTDLDSRTGVIWNMGKIAASGHPKALELFHRIMVASAAIPGAFPPVLINVEANGKQYQEMHVDGGTVAQVFVYPTSLSIAEESRKLGIVRERNLYIIRNARLDPEWAEVERRTFDIAGRAISSLIQTQGIGDLYIIHSLAQRDGIDFNLAYIPPTFKVKHTKDFDTEYMRQLFNLGYSMAVKGYPWQKEPPGFHAVLKGASPSDK